MAIRPIKPVKVGLSPRPSRLQPDTFAALADAGLTYQATVLPDYTDHMGDFYDGSADYMEVLLDQAEAAVLMGDVAPDPGKALWLLRFNADGAGLEGVDIAALKATPAQAADGVGDGLMDATLTKASFTAQERQVGVGQTWQSQTRVPNTAYQNTTGKPLQISITAGNTVSHQLQVSQNGSTWLQIGDFNNIRTYNAIIPNQIFYRVTSGTVIFLYAELR